MMRISFFVVIFLPLNAASSCLSFCFGRNILKQVLPPRHDEMSEEMITRTSTETVVGDIELRGQQIDLVNRKEDSDDDEVVNILMHSDRSNTEVTTGEPLSQVVESTINVLHETTQDPSHSSPETVEDAEVIDLRATLDEINNDELLRASFGGSPEGPPVSRDVAMSRPSTPEDAEVIDLRATLDEILEEQWDKVF